MLFMCSGISSVAVCMCSSTPPAGLKQPCGAGLCSPRKQCCGSMTFWCGFGSGDPCLWRMDPDPDADPDPSIFIIDLQDANQKIIFLTKFFCILLFEGTFTSFFKGFTVVKKKSQNSRNQGFPYYFCLMIEESGAGSVARSGSIPLTTGSGSRRPKNTWIRWIRIRIRNTARKYSGSDCYTLPSHILLSLHSVLFQRFLFKTERMGSEQSSAAGPSEEGGRDAAAAAVPSSSPLPSSSSSRQLREGAVSPRWDMSHVT